MATNLGNAEEWISKLLVDLVHQADRMLVLVSGQMVDESLYQLLDKFLIPKRSKDTDILKDSRVLGTFSARINISYQLGLISKDFARDLDILRKMRNECAHSIDDMSLNNEALAKQTKEIYAHVPKSITAGITVLMKKHQLDEKSTRAQFMGSVFRILMNIEEKIENIQMLPAPETERF
ncbi:MAG: hypothetical protein GYB33_11185 [Gammaproteobacteria bacterium]|nr:hypothetical protein [Gammaproteobacteria bacterium]